MSINSKRRYEINKGKKNFTVHVINPVEYVDDLLRVTIDAYNGWPSKYRPSVDKEKFRTGVYKWNDNSVFGAFRDGVLFGYAIINDSSNYAEFSVLRTDPTQEKLAINAAIVAAVVEHYNNRMKDGFYICDGSRSIRHETAFQDYLEKYFSFRKAYCMLHIVYRGWFKSIIAIIYPIRRIIKGNTSFGSQLHGILKMEEINRSCMRICKNE